MLAVQPTITAPSEPYQKTPVGANHNEGGDLLPPGIQGGEKGIKTMQTTLA